MPKVTVRVPGGIHYAISELADKFELSISEAAGLLVGGGLQSVDREFFSQKAQELMMADTMEAIGSLIRTMAELPPEEREQAEKLLQLLGKRLESVFPGILGGPTESTDESGRDHGAPAA